MSTLTLHQSNRLEDLAYIASVLYRLPKQDFFAPEEILIASPGIKRYLDKYLASHTGIAANIRYNRTASFFWRLMRLCLENIPEQNLYSADILQWRLMALFHSETWQSQQFAEARNVLDGYLNAHQWAYYDLAKQLADVFDQYLVYRPDWIEAWSEGKLLGLGQDEVWQVQLWQYLQQGINTPHRIALWQEFYQTLNQANLNPKIKLPERVIIFGVSTLAPMYLELLQALSKHCTVHILALNPCLESWGDIISTTELLKKNTGESLAAIGHPLLMSLGKQGRDFFDELNNLAPSLGQSIYCGDQDDSLLHRLQNDIEQLRLPQNTANKQLQDGSITIHIAHSPLRELQILKNNLIDYLQQDTQHQAQDIAVISPNIDQYIPYIEAIFGLDAADGISLPYHISDTKISRKQAFLAVIASVFDLINSRFEASKVMAVLENELILNHFELSTHNLPLFRLLIEELNIHWGWDENMRAQFGAQDPLFTWQQGIERLLTGLLLPQQQNSLALWQKIAPYHNDINLLPIINNFISLLSSLRSIYLDWQAQYPISLWTKKIQLACIELMDLENDSKHQQFFEQLDEWTKLSLAGNFTDDISFAIVAKHLQSWLNSPTDISLLRGGITFCSMIPLRSLPFKYIALIGMNDGEFPRDNKAAIFDLMAQNSKKGDRSRREDDRYLFLETLMSARNILYISYIGKSIHNDEMLTPSPLINELLDVIATMTGTTSETLMSTFVHHHPLQAFSSQYFAANNDLFSYRQDYALAQQAQSLAIPKFLDNWQTADSNPITPINLTDFITFWKNPSRYWLRRQLAWQNIWTSNIYSDAEPFTIEHEGAVNDAYFQARKDNIDLKDVDELLQAQSLLPTGYLSEYELKEYHYNIKQIDSALFKVKKLDTLAFSLELADFTLAGNLANLYQDHQQIFWVSSKLNNPQKVSYYLEHLVANAISEEEINTHIVYPQESLQLIGFSAKEAQQQLSNWLNYYISGQDQPLPFFAKTSLNVAEKIKGKQDYSDNINDLMKQFLPIAKSFYLSSGFHTGQGDYSEEKLIFGKDAQLPIEQALFWQLISELLLPLLLSSETKEPN